MVKASIVAVVATLAGVSAFAPSAPVAGVANVASTQMAFKNPPLGPKKAAPAPAPAKKAAPAPAKKAAPAPAPAKKAAPAPAKKAAPAPAPAKKAAPAPAKKAAPAPVKKAAPAPAPVAASGSFATALGAQPPLGFWDPLGILDDADQARFDRLRTVEKKHGRIAMLAVLGHIVTAAGIRNPESYDGVHSFTEVPAGLAAFNVLPAAGTAQLIGFIGLLELGFAQVQEKIEAYCEDKMDAQGWDAAKKDSKRAIELNNGRAAQMGILALMVHEEINNDPYVINALLGAPVDFNAGF